jgi:C-terminal processing protease CtpA/Prc
MEAVTYSMQLNELSTLIAERYVRPIPRGKLIETGLKGLYAASGQPVPAGLSEIVEKVIDDPAKLHRFLVLARLQIGNVEPLQGNRAIRPSLEAMLTLLDPFCQATFDSPLQARQPGPERFGLEFVDVNAAPPLIVKSVLLGSSAQKAGIRPWDEITQCNGTTVQGSADKYLSAFQVDVVRAAVFRPATRRSWTVVLYAESFEHESVLGVHRKADNSWEYFADAKSGIAQVRLAELGLNSCEELKRVLAQLQKDGLRGLLLDLRWCPGGYLEEARQIADVFLGGHQLPLYVHPTPGNLLALADNCLNHHCRNAVVRYRDGREDERYLGPPEIGMIAIPIVVVVNGETSGGAELIAAVLQDNRRAWIAGQRTRGKASVQSDLYLDRQQTGTPLTLRIPNARLKLTCGILTRPSGRNLNRFPECGPRDDWGVVPDAPLEFRVSSAAGMRLRDWWQLQSLRPGLCEEGLPLDDPKKDPQREYTLQFLRKLIH